MRSALACSIVVVVASFSACDCGGGSLVFHDAFADADPDEDSLHTYATSGRVTLKALPVDGFDAEQVKAAGTSGAVSLDPDASLVVDENGVTFTLLTADEGGAGSVELVDKNDNVLARRDVEVKAADTLTLAVTAPLTAGVALPAVDPASIRILEGRRAAFRVSTFAGDEEIFAIDNVDTSAVTPGLTQRSGVGCAEESCGLARTAAELILAADQTDPIDAVVAASGASLAVVVVPTAVEDITDVVLDEGDEFDGKKSVVATSLVGDEPVFGVDVVWSVDGADVTDDDGAVVTGDVLQFTPAQTERAVTATVGDRALPIAVSGDEFEVTAVTAACGAGPASALPLVLCLLVLRRRRR